ncbi:MAG: fluoride efflux transporter CrcB [Pseudomonadales bacterium]|jgi:CrcB protein
MMILESALWVALGGASGAVGRFLISTALFVPGQFPWPTLAINIAGSLGIGLLWGLYGQHGWFESWGRYLLVVGFLGGFTTFSAFSLETVGLIDGGRVAEAVAYVAASLLSCVLAAWLGQRLPSW